MNYYNHVKAIISLIGIVTSGCFTAMAQPDVQSPQSEDVTTNDFMHANGPAPYTLWQWVNGCVTKEGITYDLEAYKKVGIKNVQQFLIGGSEADITDPDILVLGDKWNDLMRFSLDECKRLGMDFGTHNCPGWSSSGAPGLSLDYSMQKLVWTKTPVSAQNATSRAIPKPTIDTVWNYYKDICVIAVPKDDSIVDISTLIVIIDGLDKDGKLKKALPQGEWEVVRFGHTFTGHKNLTAPVSGQGFEVDKMSRKALDAFWELYPAKLIEMAGEHVGTTFKRFEIDSYEAGYQDWTPEMPSEFKHRRGYELFPWLATMAGYTVDSKDATARFKADWQRTINDLFADNYYQYLNELTHKAGMDFLCEPYGTGKKNFDETAIRGIGDIVMCEFWTKPATWGWETLLPIASNVHVNGTKIVGAEAFTGQPQFAWQTDLADLKATGDIAFCEGVNLFIVHAAAHQPWPQVKPGMTMGWWGTQFGPSQTWWEHGAAQWVQYVTRCQLLLQKGLFVGDLCYLQLYRQKHTSIPEGYKADVCSEKELLTRFSVQNNTLVLPDGMSYKVLVLPNRCRMEPALARKIESLVNEGAIVIGNGFIGSQGLANCTENDAEVRTISERLFGDFRAKDAVEKGIRKVGKGKVYCGYSPQEALTAEQIEKDVTLPDNEKEIGWIHRNDSNKHYYFISNYSAVNKSCRISFRISGLQPEIWNPVTGQVNKAMVWEKDGDKTTVTLHLEPHGSCFVVFRNKATNGKAFKTLSINGQMADISTHLLLVNDKPHLVLHQKGVYELTDQNDNIITKTQPSAPVKIPLNDHWDVRFQENRGAPAVAHFDALISWPLHTNTGIKYFSGKARYTKSFELKKEHVASSKRLFIDLGQVKNSATIYVNGKEVAVLWKTPFAADITDYCKAGNNVLEVDVTNLWPNRIIGDKSEPDDCVWGAVRTFPAGKSLANIGRNLQIVPDWVINNTERPSKNRITFCTVDFFDKDTPLLPSGIIGPAQIEVVNVAEIK